MRGYAIAGGALSAFCLGLVLWLSELPYRSLDWLIVLLFAAGAAGAAYAYVREPALRVRRLAVLGAGLNGAALLLHGAALF